MSITQWLRGSDREPELSPELRKRLLAIEEKQLQLEKEQRGLELDWSEWFNKFRLLYARLTKRINDEEKKSLEEAPQPTNGDRPHVGYGHAQLHPPRQRKNY